MVLAVVALVAGSCGGGDTAPRSPGATGAGDGTAAAPATTTTSALPRSAPRWETVVTLEGAGPGRPAPFTVLAGAIQWRVRWSCETGSLTVTSTPPPRKNRAVVEGACPGQGEGYAIHTGEIRLDVNASGPWRAVVDQQLDTPLVEPPLPGMDPGAVVGQGQFVGVEMSGEGTARLFTLPDGRLALRFEDDFRVSANSDLFLWLSSAELPRTSKEALDSPHVRMGNLRSTLGSQNYVLPPDLTADRVRSVVIWCEPVAIAYAAAPLTPG